MSRSYPTKHVTQNGRGSAVLPRKLVEHDPEFPLPSFDITPALLAQKLAKRGLRIGRTNVGKGVFATKRLVDGTCIGEIEGRVIDDDNYVSRYSFDLDDGKQLEPAYPFRFVNHSCEPNCAFQSFAFSQPSQRLTGERTLLLFAICDITIGQELTIDYNWPACFAIPCNCRAASCRGWIVDSRELTLLTTSHASA